jgi:hypothetical protein
MMGCATPSLVGASGSAETPDLMVGEMDYSIFIQGPSGNFTITGAELLSYGNVSGLARVQTVHHGFEGDYSVVGANMTKLLEEVGPWGPGGQINFTCSDGRVFPLLYEDVVCNSTAQSVLGFEYDGALLAIDVNPRLVVVGTAGDYYFNWGNYTAKAVRNVTVFGDIQVPTEPPPLLGAQEYLLIGGASVTIIALITGVFLYRRKN